MKEKVKNVIDFVITLITVIVLLPLFLVIALIIKLDSKGPVFFIQERVGKDGEKFKFLKFRSMAHGAPDTGLEDALEHNPHITKVGKFIRETTLDELPQLINVLRGNMTLVGPRPLPEYKGQNEKLREFFRKRNSIKPGLIGLNDIKGRGDIPWEERNKNDLWYIENRSLLLDFKILFLGFFAVLSKKGIYGKEDNKLEKK